MKERKKNKAEAALYKCIKHNGIENSRGWGESIHTAQQLRYTRGECISNVYLLRHVYFLIDGHSSRCPHCAA
ncbi:hypothetical protein POVCU2_0020560 [Plasmodium ovale curtisi]|uniref:Uncharacterized protein n=1 Tax=Plasmodium ovale curtisi TaxID=864141 RepID=A0A1A8VS84_PLAOA|nr:hypothetical protein POVCU2_0020560 [Plasmodium ovale curtisi]SBS90517.1 hypothetical protein POVCU1_018500 [Plasmodium ovale curtisi]